MGPTSAWGSVYTKSGRQQPTIPDLNGTLAAYIRRSTFEQENQHQNDVITEWLTDHDLDLSDVDLLTETASGANRNRE
jgi:hypothetical protein